jgi:hypothetical protein
MCKTWPAFANGKANKITRIGVVSLISNLQVLRAVAALGVVVYHTNIRINGVHSDLMGVAVFFVISGFIMVYITRQADEGFLLKRLIRTFKAPNSDRATLLDPYRRDTPMVRSWVRQTAFWIMMPRTRSGWESASRNPTGPP